jgi:hypothetical protein
MGQVLANRDAAASQGLAAATGALVELVKRYRTHRYAHK